MKRFLVPLAITLAVAAPLIAGANAKMTIYNRSDRSVWITAYSATTLRPISESCLRAGQTKDWYGGNVAYLDFVVKSSSDCGGHRVWGGYGKPHEVAGGNQEGTFTLHGPTGGYSLHGP